MGTRTEQDFIEWISGASIYIGYARYGQFGGHGFVCASKYDESEKLRGLVECLDGGDDEALNAEGAIAKMDGVWIGNDPDPAKSMQKMLNKAKKFYFYELNDGND